MEAKRIKKLILTVIVLGICLSGITLGAILWQIDRAVKQYSALARQQHPNQSDDVTALIAYMNSDQHTLKQRNLAVWTLGRLKNPRALPALEAVYTAEKCDHDKNLCQYELSKAIKRCGGNPKPINGK